jgi:hypothetical protein
MKIWLVPVQLHDFPMNFPWREVWMVSWPGQLTHVHVLSFQYCDWLLHWHVSAYSGRFAEVGQPSQAFLFLFSRRPAELLQKQKSGVSTEPVGHGPHVTVGF